MTQASMVCRPLTAFALATLMTLAGSPAYAEEGDAPGTIEVAKAEDAAPSGVTATVTQGAEGFEVEGRFRIAVPSAVAWEVLTDYDGIPRFVSSMRESRVKERNGDHLVVEQVAVGHVFLFKRQLRTVLKVEEQPPRLIRFEDTLLKDFDHYRGEWRIEERDGEVEVIYHVQARPATSIPDFVARGMFRKTVHQLLSELEKEISNRAALAESLPPERSQP